MRSAARPESGSPAVGQPGPDSSAALPPGADPLATGPVAPQAGRARLLTWLAGTGIGASLLIMIAVSVVRDSWMYPPVAGPASGPPWDLRSGHVSAGTVSVLLWFATLAGAAGVAAGLAAVQRGARPSPRALLIGAAIAVAALTVLPPAGSTDVFDYAAYGRIAALGHSPYLMTPYRLRLAHDAFAPSVPAVWQHVVSVYGPLATLEQFLAAKLGGISVARVVFWLKLWNAIAFVVVAIVVDRLVRADPARRLRAHLLWTINPLLLWDIVAAGHLDVLAAAVGLAGLLVLGEQGDDQQRDQQGGRRGEPVSGAGAGLLRALAAGALIGIAADIKINYVLFGLGLAWALRRSPARLAAAAVAGLAALVAGYAWFGMPAVTVLADRRNRAVVDSFYRVFLINPHWRSQLALIATILVVATALLALWRMPGRRPWPPRDPAGPGPLGRLAVPLALSVPVVRRDDHLPARALPRLIARLAGAGAAGRGHDPRPAGEPARDRMVGQHGSPDDLPPSHHRVRPRAHVPVRRGGGPGLAVPVRAMEAARA